MESGGKLWKAVESSKKAVESGGKQSKSGGKQWKVVDSSQQAEESSGK